VDHRRAHVVYHADYGARIGVEQFKVVGLGRGNGPAPGDREFKGVGDRYHV
jgi:hypothetical protein